MENYLIILAVVFSHVSGYTFIGPKFYAHQASSGGARGWSNYIPYPIHAYQPSSPIQYYGRYFSDPYFSPNLQNSDYFYAQDPYSPSFADADGEYYPNYMAYYVPTGGGVGNRRLNYYEPHPATVAVEPIDELQDYEEQYAAAAEDEHVPRSQREWWLDKNVPTDEDVYYDQFNRLNGILYDGTGSGRDDEDAVKMATKKPKLSKHKSQARHKPSSLPSPPTSRFVGIDGFGRKKDRGEPVYGNFRISPRADDDNYAWTQYGGSGDDNAVAEAAETVVAQSPPHDRDEDVDELKQLAKQNRIAADMWGAESNELAGWASGNKKRNSPKQIVLEKWKKLSKKDRRTMYNEGGRMQVQRSMLDDNGDGTTRSNTDQMSEQSSVFDTIKKLLALEDRSDRRKLRLNKRKSGNKVESYKTKTSTTVIPRDTIFGGSSATSTIKSSPRTEDHTTAKAFPHFLYESKLETNTISSSPSAEIFKRSNKQLPTMDVRNNPHSADEISLVRQLDELRHQSS